MNTPQNDLATLQECAIILRHLTTRRKGGRTYRLALRGEDAALRLAALVDDQDYAGCMVAGAEDEQ
jgi:hypothetical protein